MEHTASASDFSSTPSQQNNNGMAIIGAACRFPGAHSLDEFWQNLTHGIESIRQLTDEELLTAGVDVNLLNNNRYIKAKGVIQQADYFDADFFNISAQEAQLLDPQQRLLLLCVWEALEQAGYTTEQKIGKIGVFCGQATCPNNYYHLYLENNIWLNTLFNQQYIYQYNNPNYLSSRISSLLNFTGPSYTLHNGSATTFMALAQAWQSLALGHCDLAIVGVVNLSFPLLAGYLYQEGSQWSADGHCRVFDQESSGTVPSDGCGVVILRRLSDAQMQRDAIMAVLRGYGLSHQGANPLNSILSSDPRHCIHLKNHAIAQALRMADCDPKQINYIETHSCGILLQDTLELTDLQQIYNTSMADMDQRWILGSVKANVGHLGVASGMASLIKTILCLQHKTWVPNLGVQNVNPCLGLSNHFAIQHKKEFWSQHDKPRRAAINLYSSQGLHGHLILEQAPVQLQQKTLQNSANPRTQILLLSAKTQEALQLQLQQYSYFLKKSAHSNIYDLCFTTQLGRTHYPNRTYVLGATLQELQKNLNGIATLRSNPANYQKAARPLLLLGNHYSQLGTLDWCILEAAPIFDQSIQNCLDYTEKNWPAAWTVLSNWLHESRTTTRGAGPDKKTASSPCDISGWQQQELLQFVILFATTQQWLAWGIQAQGIWTHGIGEYVAGVIQGIWPLNTALDILKIRNQLLQTLQPAMLLIVRSPLGVFLPLLQSYMEITATLDQNNFLLKIKTTAFAEFTQQLTHLKITYEMVSPDTLALTHAERRAIHTLFIQQLTQFPFRKPVAGWYSSTGQQRSAHQLCQPSYWAELLFKHSDCSRSLADCLAETPALTLELNTQAFFTDLIRNHRSNPTTTTLAASHGGLSWHSWCNCIGQLWMQRVFIDWEKFNQGSVGKRTPLPTYPFHLKPYKPNPMPLPLFHGQPISSLTEPRYYQATWRWTSLPSSSEKIEKNDKKAALATLETKPHYWIVSDNLGLGEELLQALQLTGSTAQRIFLPSTLTLAAIAARLPTVPAATRIVLVHLASLSGPQHPSLHAENFSQYFSNYYLELTLLQQAIGLLTSAQYNLCIITNGLWKIDHHDLIFPEKSLLLGPALTRDPNYLPLACQIIDIGRTDLLSYRHYQRLIQQLLQELQAASDDQMICYRNKRLVQRFFPIEFPQETQPPLDSQGCYLITHGLGEIGLTIAESIVRNHVEIFLIEKSAFIPRAEWENYLTEHAVQDPTGRIIQRLLALEQMTRKIDIISADVTNLASMQLALYQIKKQNSKIRGVFYTDAIARPHKDLAKSQSEWVLLKTKALGCLVLHELFKTQNLDFFILCSDLSATTGDYNNPCHNSANAFIAAFAHWRQLLTGNTTTITWDTWHEEHQHNPFEQHAESKQHREQLYKRTGITRAQGRNALRKIIGTTDAQLYVSKRNVDEWFKHYFDLETEKQLFLNKAQLLQVSSAEKVVEHLKSFWKNATGYTTTDQGDGFVLLESDPYVIIQFLKSILLGFGVEVNPQELLQYQSIKKLGEFIFSKISKKTILLVRKDLKTA